MDLLALLSPTRLVCRVRSGDGDQPKGLATSETPSGFLFGKWPPTKDLAKG